MEALRSLWCRVGCASRVSLLSVPMRGWLLSALGQQGLSLLRQGDETRETTRYDPQRAVDCDVNLLHVWASAPDRGTVFSCRKYQGLCGDPQCLAEAPQVVPARRRMSATLDVTFPATSSRCCLKFSIRSRRTPRYFGAC